jgi:branched-chain amino acid transport system ATP-binding protein
VLEVRRLQAAYGPIRALWDVSLRVDAGEIVALLGSNGAGKSTTIRAISGIVRPTAGQIEFFGRRIDGRLPHEIVEAGLIQIPEGRQIWGDLSVRDNLELGAFARRARAQAARSLALVESLFPILAQRARMRARSLSGGQQQMLAIARGLMSRPALLILDEPSLGLAPQVVEEVFKTLIRINEEGIAVLLVEQNVDFALRIADRAYVMENGRIVRDGPSEALRSTDEIRMAYLGL